MEDVDIDFEIGSDPIRKFLLHKLKEIQLNNEELESQINRRQEMASRCIEKIATEMNQNRLEITEIWQKIVYGNWVVGIEVKNTDESGIAENVDITIQWDSPSSFTYTTSCFSRYKEPPLKKSNLPIELTTIIASMEKVNTKTCDFVQNEWIQTTDIKQSGVIVVSFPIPEFIDRQNYQLNGILTYEYKTEQLQLNFPTIEISIQNFINGTIEFKKYDLISGDEKSYLSMVSASEKTNLVVEYGSNDTSFAKTLEFDCLFNRIKIFSKKKNAFFVDCLSEAVNNSMIIIEEYDNNVYDFIIYSRERSVCHQLLHYIYKSIPNILILPRQHRNLLMERKELKSLLEQGTSHSNFQDKLKSFAKSMESQMFLIEKFCNKKLDEISPEDLKNMEDIYLNARIEDYQRFRLQLSDLEHQTDLQYQIISNLIESLNTAVEPR